MDLSVVFGILVGGALLIALLAHRRKRSASSEIPAASSRKLGPLILSDDERFMLSLIDALSGSSTTKMLNRQSVIAATRFESSGAEQVLKSLRRHLLIRYRPVGQLTITEAGIVHVKSPTQGPQGESGEPIEQPVQRKPIQRIKIVPSDKGSGAPN